MAVAKSRSQIDALLCDWGCSQIQWSDDYKEGRAMLQFLWERDELSYLARFVLQLPDEETLREEAKHATQGYVLDAKLERLRKGRGRTEHRMLLLWIKAALNAVEAGIIEPETVFLPWLVGQDGKTVAEVALPRLERLLSGNATTLLGAGTP